jgi:hypothetical protein
MRVVRILGIAFAALVCAWFVLGIRQAHELGNATSILSQPGFRTPGQLREVSALIRSAGTLNPDAQVDIARGRVAIDRQTFPAARRILGDVVRREPMNLEAWIWLAGASLNDRPELHLALAHWALLDPLDVHRG